MGNASRKPATPLPSSAATAINFADSEEANEDYLDPRSPTPDVARTPISGKDGIKNKITKNADLTQKFENCEQEEKVIHNNPIISAVIRNHLQLYDPRSPTQDFDRTPVVLALNKINCNNQPHNGSISFEADNDENAMDPEVISETFSKHLSEDFLDATLDSTFRDPEPLGSSTASQDAIENETSLPAPKTLLETNFHYLPKPTDKVNTKSEVGRMFKEDFQGTIKNRFKIVETDPRSPSQGIDRTPILLPQKEAQMAQEKVEVMSEESLIAALQNGIADFRCASAQGDNGGLLIYEDDSANTVEFTPRKTKSATKGTRTPLACMKNKTDERSKSDAAFADAKKKVVSRIPKRINSIPRLQKTMSLEIAKSQLEHENTPPTSERDAWDKESSVVL